ISNVGIEQASVRTIAKEAGLSLGALRYYFTTQEELLRFSMQLVQERVQERITTIFERGGTPEETLCNVLLEVLPYAPEHQLEMQVWFQFMMYAYASQSTENPDDIYHMCLVLLTRIPEGTFRADIDIELESERLAALVDGLAFHALFRPERLPKERLRHVLVHHLNALFVRPLAIDDK
ncbi:MAG TPA: TetR family transcriptional regulator, partial [Exiguobacterium sp.]|nr:TetR family transcriptional regulator [Exiguobacterium sp.]